MRILLIRFALFATLLLSQAPPASADPPADQQPAANAAAGDPSHDEIRTIRGRVVWMYEAVKRNLGIKTVSEAAESVLALETADGQLIPILEDIRGRGFRRDERLRGVEMELLVRQHKNLPFVQVIKVFAVKPDGKYELDYWCEICAIAMFELKPCDCCQGDIELRQRKVYE